MSLCPRCHLPLRPPQASHPPTVHAFSFLQIFSIINRLIESSPHISALISALAFCDAFQLESNTGKARLFDGFTSHGPSSGHTRMPKSDRSRRILESGIDPISTRAAFLLACPPHLIEKNCLSCSFHSGPTPQPLGLDARHYVRCPKGLRLHNTASDRARDELS